MIALDLPPKLILPVKELYRPAIIRPLEQKLLSPNFLPASRDQKRAALRELVATGKLTREEARRALVFFCPVPIFQSSAVAATVSNTDHTSSSSALTTYTFSTRAIGTAATGRRIIVIATGYSTTGGRTISSVSVGGNAATHVVTGTDSGGAVNSHLAGIYIIQVDTGTTATIDVVFSAGMAGCDVGIFAAYDLLSSTPTDTGTSNANPMTDTIDIAAGGICVAGNELYATGATGHSWTGLTERYDDTQQAQIYYSGACDAFAAAQTALAVTCTPASYVSAPWAIASFR